MAEAGSSIGEPLDLRRGELVRVRSEEAILATLDQKGELDGLPFMPEMFRYCGRTYRVHRRADKTCDTISGQIRALRMRQAVHLEDLRCDGAAHGGCEAACLIFWKEAWLERTDPPRTHRLWSLAEDRVGGAPTHPEPGGGCTRAIVEERAIRSTETECGETTWRCQITQLLEATTPLSSRAPRQYLRDWLSGNVLLSYLLRVAILRFAARLVYGRGFRMKVRLYDRLARLFGEPAWPYHPGRVEGRTPTGRLDLQPGELVTVKSHDEILDTLKGMSNRGLDFAPEMVRYCGKTFRVRARVEKILDERTGRMVRMKNDCIILENVVCQSECSVHRLFCPRGIFPYWREIWLRRADGEEADEEGKERPASAVPDP